MPKKRPTTKAGRGMGPTREQQIQSAVALGATVQERNDGSLRLVTKKGVDETMKGTALGRLYAKGHIQKYHLEAGEFLQELAWRAWGVPEATASRLERLGGQWNGIPCPDGPEATQAKKIYSDLKNELRARTVNGGYWIYGSVLTICVHDREPDWSDRKKPTANDIDSRSRIKYGLDILAELTGHMPNRFKHYEWDKEAV